MPTIAELLALGRLEQLPADATEARELIRHAQTHIESAKRIIDDDAVGAYQLAYDAARNAAAADMIASGYRAKSDRRGAHAAIVPMPRRHSRAKPIASLYSGSRECGGSGTGPSTAA